jgi:electron transfer flavoprotein beta subunit
VRVAAPVVICVSPDVCEAPIPGVKDILNAKKKPANALNIGDIGMASEALSCGTSLISMLAPVSTRQKKCLNPEGVTIDQAAAALVKELSAAGIL